MYFIIPRGYVDVNLAPMSRHQLGRLQGPFGAKTGHRLITFDHLVGARLQRHRHGEAQRLGEGGKTKRVRPRGR